MRIWIIKAGEPVVFHPDAADLKPMRAALLARELARRGHDVIWWASAFDHYRKKHLQPSGTLLKTDIPNLQVYLVPAPGYASNISLARMRDHAALARNWRQAIESAPAPDIMMAAWPPVELAHAAVLHGRRCGIPVLLDVRDLWPDIIYERLRMKARLPWMPRFLRHYERMTREAFSHATGIMGITDPFVQWGLRKAGRQACETDKAFFLTSEHLSLTDTDERLRVEGLWRERGVDLHASRVLLAWVGTLLDTPTTRNFLHAVAHLPEKLARKIRLVICGKGTLEAEVEKLAHRCPHVIYAGFVDHKMLTHLLQHVDYGVIPYERMLDFQLSIPNKVGEYLGAGAHIATTLTGEVARVLRPCGVVHLMQPDRGGITQGLGSLVEMGKLDSRKRDKARSCHRSLFDSEAIMNAMADHVQSVANGWS